MGNVAAVLSFRSGSPFIKQNKCRLTFHFQYKHTVLGTLCNSTGDSGLGWRHAIMSWLGGGIIFFYIWELLELSALPQSLMDSSSANWTRSRPSGSTLSETVLWVDCPNGKRCTLSYIVGERCFVFCFTMLSAAWMLEWLANYECRRIWRTVKVLFPTGDEKY